MRNLIVKYKEELKEMYKDKYLIVIIVLTILLGFGFCLSNSSISIDDTAFLRYLNYGECLSQGRFFPIIVSKALLGLNFLPFWLEFLSLIILSISSVLYCCFFKIVTSNKLKKESYYIFVGIFLSYPLINEIFIYQATTISVGLGYLFSIITSILIYEFFKSKNKILLLVSILFLMACISMYESFLVVIILNAFLVIFFDSIFNNDKNKYIQWIKSICLLFILIIFAVLLEYFITDIYLNIKNIQQSNTAATNIYWISNGLIKNIKPFFESIYKSFLILEYYYLPIIIFQISVILFLVFSIITSIKKRNFIIFFVGLSVILCNFLLTIIQGIASPYRTCQSFALFVAFVAIVIFNFIPKKWDWLWKIFIVYVVLIQTHDLAGWFYNDYKRYNEEKNVIINIANQIYENYDSNKPIAFTGEYILSEDIKHNQTNGSSVINWGMVAFGEPNTELYNFLSMHGYYFIKPSSEQITMARNYSVNMEKYPKNGYIQEYENIIIVKF